MDVLQKYLIGLALLLVSANQSSKADATVDCPNLPITPYPLVQTRTTTVPTTSSTVECPNLPITPYPPVQTTTTTLPTTVITVRPTSPCQTACIQNSPNLCLQKTIYPCQITCVQNPLNPCVCPGTVQPTNPCQTVCDQNPPNPCPTTPSNCCQTYPAPTSPCSTTTTTIPPPPLTTITTTLPTISLPPEPIIMCPPGTILIGQTCHIIHCPPGSIMQNDRCMFIECPDGTVWTGHRCSVPYPIVHSFTFNNTITTHVNQSTPDIIFNSTKNIVLNLPLTINEYDNNNNSININCKGDVGECHEETTKEPVTQNCCEVKTPRICEKYGNRWHCFSRRSRRCGDFCIAPIIYLKPPRVYASTNYVVLPPIQRDCEVYGTCGAITGGHDCSGCAMNDMSRCSYYCYRYSCPSRKCQFFDHQQYCSNNTDDMFGCQKVDGCYDDWCINK